MSKRLNKIILSIAGLLALLALVLIIVNTLLVGRSLDSFRNVRVFDNGLLYFRAYGRHYSSDGYYYGQKWQCVEFIKRFYFDALGHRMTDVMGHAKDFFDPDLSHRGYNARRDMIQFLNGGDEPPATDDLLVFRDTAYGHVAIVVSVDEDRVEVIQQNIIGRPRQTFTLQRMNGAYSITAPRSPAGWLRVRSTETAASTSQHKTAANRVEVTGFRPSPLPHHRTCGSASGGSNQMTETGREPSP